MQKIGNQIDNCQYVRFLFKILLVCFVFFILFYSWKHQVAAACLSVLVSTIDINKSNHQRELANRLSHVSLGFVFFSTFCNVIKMNFGLDPAIWPSHLINKPDKLYWFISFALNIQFINHKSIFALIHSMKFIETHSTPIGCQTNTIPPHSHVLWLLFE